MGKLKPSLAVSRVEHKAKHAIQKVKENKSKILPYSSPLLVAAGNVAITEAVGYFVKWKWIKPIVSGTLTGLSLFSLKAKCKVVKFGVPSASLIPTSWYLYQAWKSPKAVQPSTTKAATTQGEEEDQPMEVSGTKREIETALQKEIEDRETAIKIANLLNAPIQTVGAEEEEEQEEDSQFSGDEVGEEFSGDEERD